MKSPAPVNACTWLCSSEWPYLCAARDTTILRAPPASNHGLTIKPAKNKTCPSTNSGTATIWMIRFVALLCTGGVSLHAQDSSSGKDMALRSSDEFCVTAIVDLRLKLEFTGGHRSSGGMGGRSRGTQMYGSPLPKKAHGD